MRTTLRLRPSMLEAIGTYPAMSVRSRNKGPVPLKHVNAQAKRLAKVITDTQLHTLSTVRFIEHGRRIPTPANIETISAVLIRGSANPLPELVGMQLVEGNDEHIFTVPEGARVRSAGKEVYVRGWQKGRVLDTYRVTELGATLLNNMVGELEPAGPDQSGANIASNFQTPIEIAGKEKLKF